MKILRIATTILFIATVVLFGLFYMDKKKSTDYTYPTIQAETQLIEVSVDATEEELLAGVTAYDEKDGDITDKIVVESVSRFDKNHECTITYAVCDSNNHVAKTSRILRYKNYIPPKFTMRDSLVFGLDEEVSIHDALGAEDSIDGDISDKVVITATDFSDDSVGVFSLSLQATNSMGDIVYLDLPIYVENISAMAPTIELTEYLIYVKKGEKPDFSSYVSSVTYQGHESQDTTLDISTDFNPDKPGLYSVHYHATRASIYESHNVLNVIVEE